MLLCFPFQEWELGTRLIRELAHKEYIQDLVHLQWSGDSTAWCPTFEGHNHDDIPRTQGEHHRWALEKIVLDSWILLREQICESAQCYEHADIMQFLALQQQRNVNCMEGEVTIKIIYSYSWIFEYSLEINCTTVCSQFRKQVDINGLQYEWSATWRVNVLYHYWIVLVTESM